MALSSQAGEEMQMSFFRWLADTARSSNDRAHDRRMGYERSRSARQSAEWSSRDNSKCCANCTHFSSYTYDGKSNHCTLHDCCIDAEKTNAGYRDVGYTRVCSNFIRK